ncbi:MAG: SRPBCC family protein, partial [Caulobacteraceae bacterium]
ESHTTRLDVRVGGAWEIIDRRGGVDYRAIGEYVEVERPSRLVFTFGMPQFDPGFSRVTVEIAADGAGARMTLIHEILPPDSIPPLEDGWDKMFEFGLAPLLAA